MKLLILAIVAIFVNIQTKILGHFLQVNGKEMRNTEIKNTFQLLDEGKERIVLNEHKDLVLVLGNTGSGKSTLIQWLFGDNDKLIATQNADKTFLIVDGNRIGHSTIVSKTLFPEFVIDDSTNTAYYDCPGFSDTRTTSHNIATTYFIKTVADHAVRVKLVFVVNYFSLRKGVARNDFLKLLSHLTDFIKDISKFRDGITLIATKVDNLYVENDDGDWALISDEDVIQGIAEFLTEVKDALKDDVSKSKLFINSAVQFIDILLYKESNGSYSKIGLFRRPSKPGPLSKSIRLQKGKTHVLKIFNRSYFVTKNSSDFGYTVSERTLNDINDLIQEISSIIDNNLGKVGKTLLDYFHMKVTQLNNKLDAFVSGQLSGAEHFNPNEIEQMTNFIDLGIQTTFNLIEEIKNLSNPSELANIVRFRLFNLDTNMPVDEIGNIHNQGKYFIFLQLVSKRTFLLPKSWALKFESNVQNLTTLKVTFQKYTNFAIEKLNTQVETLYSYFGKVIFSYHHTLVEQMKNKINLFISGSIENVTHSEIINLNKNLIKGVNVTSVLIADIKLETNFTLLATNLINYTKSFGNTSINEKNLLNFHKYLNFLQLIKYETSKIKNSWAVLFEREVIKISNFKDQFQVFTNLLLEDVSIKIENIIIFIMQKVQVYYKDMTNQLNYDIDSFVNGLVVNTTEVKNHVANLNKGLTITSNLSLDSVYISTPIKLGEKIELSISSLDLNFLDKEVENITNQVMYLDFLSMVSSKTFTMPIEWVKLFQATANHLAILNDNFNKVNLNLTINIKNVIRDLIDNVGQDILKYYLKLISTIEFKIQMFNNETFPEDLDPIEAMIFKNHLHLGINITSALANDIKNLNYPNNLVEKVNQSISNIRMDISDHIIKNISKNGQYLNFLQIASNINFEIPPDWGNIIETVFEKLTKHFLNFQNTTHSQLELVNKKIESSIEIVKNTIIKHYEKELNQINAQIIRLSNETDLENVTLLDAKQFISRLNQGIEEMRALEKQIKLLNTSLDLPEIIDQSISKLTINMPTRVISNLLNQSKYLNVLLLLSEDDLHFHVTWGNEFGKIIENLMVFLEDFKNNITMVKIKVEGKIGDSIANIGELIKEDLELQFNELKTDISYFTLNSTYKISNQSKAKEFAFNFQEGLITMFNLNQNITNLTSLLILNSAICEAISTENLFNIIKNEIEILSPQVQVLEFLLSAGNIKFQKPDFWLTSLKTTHENLSFLLNNALKNIVTDTTEKIYYLLKDDMDALAYKIKSHFEHQLLNQGINNTITILKIGHKNLLAMTKNNTNSHNLLHYLNNILNCITELNIDKEIINKSFKRITYLKYMEEFTDSNLIRIPSFINLESFHKVITFIHESQVWYTFLFELYEMFSQYTIQKDVSRYNVANLEDWGKEGKKQGIHIDKNNFHEFLNKIGKKGEIQNILVTDSHLKELEYVLRSHFKHQYYANCESRDKIIIESNFIKFSDFTDENGYFKSPCNFTSNNIRIFSLNTVFIDRDLNATGKELRLTVIAPKWEVIGNRQITLDGENAGNLNPVKANNGKQYGSNGDDGKPGLSGGSAGSILGIGKYFIRGSALTIYANGGRGGFGQEGGNGANGKNGEYVSYEQMCNYNRILTLTGWHTRSFHDRVDTLKLSYYCKDNYIVYNKASDCDSCKCVIYGSSGEKGGDGGKGGAGGVGGKKGYVKIIELENVSRISKFVSSGFVGENGVGGKGGCGGESRKVKVDYKFYYPVHWLKVGAKSEDFEFLEYILDYGENGKNGEDNENTQDKKFSHSHCNSFRSIKPSRPSASDNWESPLLLPV